ncbi:MAG: dTDP-4-dehydrorhamnose reductase [Actinomycetia bacterium]|nr:dTDP-4-dehydrorhamnose reductase [Actinomycetes bacterium]
MKRHLVVGAHGQVGRHLVRALAARGEPVVRAGRREPADLLLDLDRPETLPQALAGLRADILWLCAAYTHVDGCEADPDRSRRINLDSPAVLARWAAASGCRVVFFSTDYVFDGRAGPYTEADPPHPLSVYGRHKQAAEEVLAATLGPRALVVRTAWVYSRDPGGTNFFEQVRAALTAGRPLAVAADQFGNPTYAPDLVDAVLALVDRRAAGLFHVAGATVMTRAAFAEAIRAALGGPPDLIRPVATRDLGQRAPRPLRAGLVTTKLQAVVGFVPRPPEPVLAELARTASPESPASS